MKKALFAIGLLSLSITAALAQEQASKANSRSMTTNASGNAAGNGSIAAAGKSLDAGTALSGQLQNTLDVKRSKVGDPVILKTTRAIKQNGETIVPKGSQLVGRITEITQRSKSNNESRIGMVFDRLQGSNLSQPISASIVSITNVAQTASVGDDLFSSSTSGSSSSSGSVRGGGNSGGGLLGGTGGLVGGVTNTAGSVLNTTTNTVGGITNTATGTVGGATSTLGSTVNGLRISGSASGSASSSSTISSGDKNMRIDKGATFNLVVNN
jgi:hypothetical protein